jgi:hypothetical protein
MSEDDPRPRVVFDCMIFLQECENFRRRFRSLRITGPVEFLKSVEPKESNG